VFLTWANGNTRVCEYLFMTNRRRPCFAGKGCTVKQTGKKKSTWRYEADETWEIKKKAERKKLTQGKEVFHRECPACGKEFETTDSRMIYCCRKCSEKYRHNKAKAEKIVYHRICKECGTEFDTTNQRKIFCCRDHAFRYKQRQYRKEKENGEKE
jgi:hypothetical protein